jgi:hypothetical protein
MIGVAINAFSRGSWWATTLELLGALWIGWFSLGLFHGASVRAVRRAMRGEASAKDMEMLRDIGEGAAYSEAVREAHEEPNK